MRRACLILLVVLASVVTSPATSLASVGTQFCPEVEHSVLRLYRAYFERDPDAQGLGYWLSQYLGGTPLTAISDAFTHTPEFESRYAGVDNPGFVRLVYRNVLHREPDQAGLDYWTSALDSHTLVRGGVMVLFSESPEFVSATRTAMPLVIPPGTFTYCGSGDEVVQIATPGGGKGEILVAVMHGSGHHAITSHAEGFAYNDLVVNTIGEYVGENLVDLSPLDARSESLEIQSDGSWIVQMRSLATAPSFAGPTSGSGDRVVRYTGRPSTGRFTHDGQGNFIVEAVTSDDWDLVVNEIGTYDGRRPVENAPSFLAVSAAGNWTMQIPG